MSVTHNTLWWEKRRIRHTRLETINGISVIVAKLLKEFFLFSLGSDPTKWQKGGSRVECLKERIKSSMKDVIEKVEDLNCRE